MQPAGRRTSSGQSTSDDLLEAAELELAKQAMERTGGNLTQAAKLLDITRDQLRYKLKKSGEYASQDSNA